MIERLKQLQKDFAELYDLRVVHGVDKDYVHVSNNTFEELACNSLWVTSTLTEYNAHVYAIVEGMKLVTLYGRK